MSQAGQFYRSGLISTLTGDTGGAVGPTAGNIDLVGGAGVTVDGVPGTSTLTVSVAGVITSLVTDAGTATPLAGVVNFLGGTNIGTTGAGNTVTVNLDNDVVLSGQLEANEIESLTYITAVTDITAITGNISAPGGNIATGGTLTATGDITSTTGDLNTVIGNLDIGGTANIVGSITSTTGNVIAQTGDIVASAGAGIFATTVTAGTGVTATTGNVEASSGNIIASGTITAGTGLIATTGGVLASAGDITATLGDIVTSAGSITSAANITADGDITSINGDIDATTGNLTTGGNVLATGNITTSAGNLVVTAGTITSSGHIISSAGNIITTTGEINSGSTISAVGNITSSTGDIISTLGDLRAPSGTLYVSGMDITGDIVTSAGNITATVGDVTAGAMLYAGTGVRTAAGDLEATLGDVLVVAGGVSSNDDVISLNGGIFAPNGDISSGYNLIAGADISTTLGDITAEQGSIWARYDIESIEGHIIAQAGNIRTLVGFIRSADKVYADQGLVVYAGGITSTGTTTLNDLGIGIMRTDASGVVSSTAGNDGQILIGDTGGTPAWASITSIDASITVVEGGNTIDLSAAFSGTNAFDTDSGSAAPSAGNIDILGGTLIATSGATNVVTVGLDDSGATHGQLIIGNTGGDAAWASLASAGGTVTITPGANSINLEVGAAPGYLNALAGDTGSASPTVGSITIVGGTNITTAAAASAVTINLDASPTVTTCFATTFDTNVAAAAVTLAGTSLLADGTDANIDINITAKGTGQVIIDDLQLTTDLAVTEGGTGASTFTDHGVLVGSGAGVLTAIAVGTDGQVLLGSTGADPVYATLASAGSTITFTPGAGTLNLEASGGTSTFASDSGSATPAAGTITFAGGANVTTSAAGSTVTINATGSGDGFTWNEETGAAVTMVAGNGYIANSAGLVTCTLPATAAVGASFRVVGKGTGLWVVAQNASQQINFAGDATTLGVGGSLAAVLDSDCVEILCITANTEFQILSSMGNITIV